MAGNPYIAGRVWDHHQGLASDLNPRETAATALSLDRSRTAQTPTKAKSAFAKIRVVFVKYSRSQTKQLIRIGLRFVRSAFIFRFVIYYFYNPTLKSNEIQADCGYTLASLVAQRVKRPWVREIPWRRKWRPTPVFLPGESHGRRTLVGYSPRGLKLSNFTFTFGSRPS